MRRNLNAKLSGDHQLWTEWILSENSILSHWAFLNRCGAVWPSHSKVTVIMLENKANSRSSCVQTLFTQAVSDGARTNPSEPEDGASSDCCWLTSEIPHVCQCDGTILLPGCLPRAPSPRKVRNRSSCLVSAQNTLTVCLDSPKCLTVAETDVPLSYISIARNPSLWDKRDILNGAFLSVKRMAKARKIVNEHFWHHFHYLYVNILQQEAQWLWKVSAFEGQWIVTTCTNCINSNIWLAGIIQI